MPKPAFNRASTARLVGLMVAGVLALAATGHHGTTSAMREGTRDVEASLRSAELLDLTRSIQVAFKIQVQNWKNLLLRGHVPQDRSLYLGRFDESEGRVDRLLSDLASREGLAPDLADEVRAIATSHADLGRRYREAFARFRAGDPPSTFEVDASVRGIDQDLDRRIDAVAERVLERQRASTAEVEARLATRALSLERMLSIATGSTLVLFAFLVWRFLSASG